MAMIDRWELKGREGRSKDNAETLRTRSFAEKACGIQRREVSWSPERKRGSHEIFVYTRTLSGVRRVSTAACDAGFFAAKLAISGRNDACQSSRH
jgi:hypothetical protein